jgi:hypothetical protein
MPSSNRHSRSAAASAARCAFDMLKAKDKYNSDNTKTADIGCQNGSLSQPAVVPPITAKTPVAASRPAAVTSVYAAILTDKLSSRNFAVARDPIWSIHWTRGRRYKTPVHNRTTALRNCQANRDLRPCPAARRPANFSGRHGRAPAAGPAEWGRPPRKPPLGQIA